MMIDTHTKLNRAQIAILGFVFFVLLPFNTFAYERLYNSGSTGVATSSAGGNSITWSNNSTRSWIVIDCSANSWSEIASTTLYMDTVSSSGSFRLWDDWSGQKSVENYTITTTPNNYSYTFSPPIWCEGRQVIFTRMKSTSPSIRMYGHNSAVAQLKGSYTISGPSSNNTLTGSETANRIPSMIIVGSFSTSTGGGGGEEEITATIVDATGLIAGNIHFLTMILSIIMGTFFSLWCIKKFWK